MQRIRSVRTGHLNPSEQRYHIPGQRLVICRRLEQSVFERLLVQRLVNLRLALPQTSVEAICVVK